jgi:probable phosphoglycerate mutase
MLLLLIRHGLTGQTGSKLTGWLPGVHLSAEGREQADALVARFEGLGVDAVYSSPLERCRETAQPFARARSLKIRTRAELGEVRYGRIQGKTYKVLGRSALWQHLNAWPSDVRFPGGEKLRETQARGVAAIDGLREKHGHQTVAVFSHADWIRLALAHFMGIHIDLYRRLSIDPAGVSALAFGERWVQVRRVNDTGPIADLGSRARPRAGKATGK